MKKEKYYYVVGVFDCGCNYEAGLSSVEVVSCENVRQVKSVKKKFEKHSANHQCDKRGAQTLLIFETFRTAYTYRETNRVGHFYQYKDFITLWRKQDKWKENLGKANG